MNSADSLASAEPPICVVVDDHIEMLGAMKDTLESEGLVVAGVASTREAGLRIVRAVQPVIAVVDLELPDMSGIELAVRALWHGRQTSFVLHSARIDAQTVADALAVGIRGLVVKNSP